MKDANTKRERMAAGAQGATTTDAPEQKLSAKALGRVLSYLIRPNWAALLVVVACIAISALATTSATLFTQTLIDDHIVPMVQAGSTDFSALAADLARLGVLLAVGVVAAYAYNRIMVSVSQSTMRRLRDEAFAHMERLPLRYFDTHSHGQIMSVYTNDADTLRQLFGQTLPQVVNSGITLVVTFVSMCLLSLPLTCLSLAMIAAMLMLTSRLANRSAGHFSRQQEHLAQVNGYIEEMMDGQKVVKTFSHEGEAIEGFRAVNERLRESAYRANYYGNLIMPVNTSVSNLSYVLIAVVGAALALTSAAGLTLGALVSFLSLSRNFTQPITQLSQQVGFVAQAAAGASRIFALMDEEPEKDGGYVGLVCAREREDGLLEPCEEHTGTWAWRHPHHDGTVTYQRQKGSLVMEHVDFGYTQGKRVLEDVSLQARPGQKIAFVGSTGAGKTTIANLINRFYGVGDGKIRYDGININKIRVSDLRRSLGLVLQDTKLFSGTVMDNIRYGRLDATDDECIAAAKLAEADEFIRRLPHGYQTRITESGSELSQGQRQLLAIARAAVADPPALILDEATSSIDTRTEEIVQRGMDALMRGRTTFVIAHRLSTVRNADCIMVMEHGQIVERGSHDELMAQRGRYWQLYMGGEGDEV